MASIRKNTKFLTTLLAVLLVAIWGEIAYQLFMHGNASPATGAALSVTRADRPAGHRVHFVFKNDVRDPFTYAHAIVHLRRKPTAIPLKVHLWSPPRVSLEGVILGDGKRTAILSTEKGQTYFLTKGDTLEGLKILKVDDREVEYRYQKKDTSWVVTK